MPPKPFALPLSVGTDIARVSRFTNLTKNELNFNRFAQKIFTRLEWGFLARKCAQSDRKHVRVDFDVLPVPRSEGEQNNDDAEGSTAIQQHGLGSWVCGRWAVKEAVIKAYSGKVGMQEISIGPAHWASHFLRDKAAHKGGGLVAVIDYPRPWVLMSPEVAMQRGLRKAYKVDERQDPDAAQREPRITVVKGRRLRLAGAAHVIYGTVCDGQFKRAKSGNKYLIRRQMRSDKAITQEIAQVSLSHDGPYASAICLASPTHEWFPSQEDSFKNVIVDDGKGEALHEPQHGDRGWVNQVMREQYVDGLPFPSTDAAEIATWTAHLEAYSQSSEENR